MLLAEYVKHGWALCPIPPGEKGPVRKGWNLREHCVTDPYIAEVLDGNVGLAHAYSGTACLDLDDLEAARTWFSARGYSVDDWLKAPDAVMITSGRENRAKLLYRVDKPLPSFKVGGFELRCASSTGTTVQDVIPPSVHPVTGKAYEWRYGDELTGHWSVLPPMPEGLAILWGGMIKPASKLPKVEREASGDAKYALKLLKDHSPDLGYDDWLGVGMALHYEFDGREEGLAIWNQWSSAGEKYQGEADLVSHWRSFHSSHDNPRTLASLRKEKVASAEDFAVVDAATAEVFENERALAAAERATPATIREAINLLKRDKQGVLNVLPNVVTVLAIPTVTGTKVAFDTFKDGLMMAPEATEEWRPIMDTDYTAMRIWMENVGGFHPVSKDMVRDAIHYIGAQHQMDTAQKWLGGLKWDGVPRIDTFMPKYMGTIDAQYERAVGKYLWTALAGRIMAPGCQVDMTPILVGKQGLGKSQGVKALVPHKDFYVELRLDEADDAIARKMRGTLVGEIAELRGLRTTDLDRIKAFVTRTDEKWTPKYMEFATTFSRRLVMIGTTNEDEFLVDDENRRWLPVRTMGVNVQAIIRDRDQLWAEALNVWLVEGVQWEEAEKLAKTAQEEYKAEDNWSAVIRDWMKDNPAPHYRSHDILLSSVGLGVVQVTRAHELRLSQIMKRLGYERRSVRTGENVTKAWAPSRPPKSNMAGHLAEWKAKQACPELDDLLS